MLLLGASAIASAAASYLLLRGMRDEITAKLVDRHEAKLVAKHEVDPTSDEFAEDAEDERPLRDTTGAAAENPRNGRPLTPSRVSARPQSGERPAPVG